MTQLTPMQLLAQRLREEQEKKKGGLNRSTSNNGDNASYPFWNIPEDSSAVVRFLPDGDPDNLFFWRERQVLKFPFAGVVGGDYPTDRPVTVTVPCIDMFGMTCPVIAETRPWWKDDSKKELARTYYKKKSYIFQGFVVSSPFVEENAPENPIRRFVIGPSLYDIIYKSLSNPEFEDLPTDYHGGRDFKISKTRKGEWANYGTSQWSFRTRPLSENELIAIDQHGLWNLKDYLGRVPDADEIEAIKQMFHDSLAGKPFDHASYGKWYRAYGGGRDGKRSGDEDALPPARTTTTVQARSVMNEERAAPAASAAAPTAAAPAAAPATSTATAGGKPQAADILAKIREKTMGRNG